jgi:putative ABC transport system permease protein
MMAVGLTRRSVTALFLLEALVLGVLGAAFGLVITVTLTWALSRHGLRFTPPSATMALDVFPFLTVKYTALALLTAIGGAVLFALYPAWRASRLRPVQALSGH